MGGLRYPLVRRAEREALRVSFYRRVFFQGFYFGFLKEGHSAVSGAISRASCILRIYPVREPHHLWQGCRKKISFFIEGGVKIPSFLTGFTESPASSHVYLENWMS